MRVEAELDRLREEATRVRQAIEAVDLSDCRCNLVSFPRNCCHHAAKLLAVHLAAGGWTDLLVVDGRGDGPTSEHVWLEVGDVVVDITADQFGGGLEPIIVTRYSPWHDAWQRQTSPIAASSITNWKTASGPVFDAYRLVLAHLENLSRTGKDSEALFDYLDRGPL